MAKKSKVDGSDAGAQVGADTGESVPANTQSNKNSTTFTFKNGGTRTFSKDVHGAKWEDLADEFAETNVVTIASRDGKAL